MEGMWGCDNTRESRAFRGGGLRVVHKDEHLRSGSVLIVIYIMNKNNRFFLQPKLD